MQQRYFAKLARESKRSFFYHITTTREEKGSSEAWQKDQYVPCPCVLKMPSIVLLRWPYLTALIRYHLYHPTTLMPRPLRFSRNRALRHWTIHRAWQLYRAKVKKNRELELERQWNSMRDACEELRVGAGDGGRLFRKAMMKTGVWGHGGIPIEYSRGMMDWVGSVGVGSGAGLGKARIWDHEWKRN
jgi:hypothetical protein